MGGIKRFPILDNGHGGVIGGMYMTPGKRSPYRVDGKVLYEGMFNRWVINRLIERLDRSSIPYFHVSPELTDVPLPTRVQRVQDCLMQGLTEKLADDGYLLSIHANAGGGRGFEVYTSFGETQSDRIASQFIKCIQSRVPDHPLRADTSDGDNDKEANFYMLRRTS